MPVIPSYALEVCVAAVGIFLLMADSFFPKMEKSGIGYAGIAGLLAVLFVSFWKCTVPPGWEIAGIYLTDPQAIFFKRFAIVSTILTIVMAMEYAPVVARNIPGENKESGLGEFFILPIFTCVGLMLMVSSADFVIIFCSLELVTISFYILVAYMRLNNQSLEAGTKYLILGALSTGFLVYGITWIFGVTGQTNLLAIPGSAFPNMEIGNQTALLFGVGLVLVALGFKIAAAPFQFWVPDVYQGAPTPVTAFLSVGSKAAGFVVLMRVIEPFLTVPAFQAKLILVLTILAALTLLYGNLAAMPQTNMKRLLAYSSIAHAGYLLVGVASVGSVIAGTAVSFYLAGYLVMTYLAFFVLLLVAKSTGGDDIAHFNGLARRSPGLALAMMVAMLSLAGLPFTVGFLGKFFIFQAAMEEAQFLLVVLGAISVACGFYYYLKVVRAMYWQPAPDDAPPIEVSSLARVCMIGLVVLILLLGVYPQPVLAMLR